MPRLTEATSMTCQQWHDADGRPCAPNTPGGRVCGAITNVDHTLEFDPEINGKRQHRKCTRCNTLRDSLVVWSDDPDDIFPGAIRIDAESNKTARLPFCD